MSISGLNFGVSDLGAAVVLQGTACSGAAWKSDTGVVCLVGAGLGTSAAAATTVTVDSLVGSALSLFMYDGQIWHVSFVILSFVCPHLMCSTCYERGRSL